MGEWRGWALPVRSAGASAGVAAGMGIRIRGVRLDVRALVPPKRNMSSLTIWFVVELKTLNYFFTLFDLIGTSMLILTIYTPYVPKYRLFCVF